MLDLWQNLPLSFHSVLISFGPIYITWYATAYLLGTVFAGAYFLLLSFRKQLFPTFGESIDLLVSILWGVLIGARLGYVFFYGGDEFFREPWRIVSPYDFSLGQWVGIRGMSFHGGMLGVIVAAEGRGADARVQVNFGSCGMKWLALQYAKLTPL